MNREIKFRAWMDGNMYYNHSVSLSIGGQVFYLQTIADWEEDTEGAVKIMQYTGLKDKNGKEIYEGDILRGIKKNQEDKEGVNAYPLNDIVRWASGGFSVFSKPMQNGYTRENNRLYQFMWFDAAHYATPAYYYQIDEIEIIGNIYENTTLLQ